MADKRFEDMTFEELVSYFHGRLCIAIGEGQSRGAVGGMVMSLQKLGYDRGLKEGKQMQRKRRAEPDTRKGE